MERFEGKTLLFLDGSPLAIPAVKRAGELGIKTIVANYYDTVDSPAKYFADVAAKVDFSDTDGMLRLIAKEHVDGIFQGWTDSHLQTYAELCAKAGLPCYGSAKAFEVCADKERFKAACRKHGVPVAAQYEPVIDEDGELNVNEMTGLQYPVLVKPSDSSGSRGVYVCLNADELVCRYRDAYAFSPTGKVIIEDYIIGQHVNVYYTLSAGAIYLSAMADRHVSFLGRDEAPLPLLLVHPSRYLSEWEDEVDTSIRALFSDLGMTDGIAFVQGFRLNEGGFAVYEMGYRPNGGGTYSLIEACSNYSQLDMLIRFALTGSMGCKVELAIQSPHFEKPALMYVLSVDPSPISAITGLDKARDIDGVVDVIQARYPNHEGGGGSHSRIVAYVLFLARSISDAARVLDEVYSSVKIIKTDGSNASYQYVPHGLLAKALNEWGK